MKSKPLKFKQADTMKKAEAFAFNAFWTPCPYCQKTIMIAEPDTMKVMKEWKKQK
jgi:hypothetical protein